MRLEEAFELHVQALGHHVHEHVSLGGQGRGGVRRQLEALELGHHPEGLHDAGRVLLEGVLGAHPDLFLLQVGEAVQGIEEPVVVRVVGDGVDGEIPAAEVVLDGPARQAYPVQAEALQGDAVGRGGVLAEGDHPAAETLGVLQRHVVGARGGEVQILGVQTERHVAEGTADEIDGLFAGAGVFEDGTEERVGLDGLLDAGFHGGGLLGIKYRERGRERRGKRRTLHHGDTESTEKAIWREGQRQFQFWVFLNLFQTLGFTPFLPPCPPCLRGESLLVCGGAGKKGPRVGAGPWNLRTIGATRGARR